MVNRFDVDVDTHNLPIRKPIDVFVREVDVGFCKREVAFHLQYALRRHTRLGCKQRSDLLYRCQIDVMLDEGENPALNFSNGTSC